jgi:VIT1/CCC1 family predicted Fe2+/Mn2+ transporter/rubrerythrin
VKDDVTTETEQKPPLDPKEVRRLQTNLDDEIDGIAVYHMLAEAESDEERKSIFEQLAEVEQRHADVWRNKLREAGVEPREHGPSLRVRLVGLLAKPFGVKAVLPIVRGMEAGAYSTYMAQDDTAKAIAPDEREHRHTIDRLLKKGKEPSEIITSQERWHGRGGGGALRASIFGVSDGLVSNTALVMGFAGAQTEGKFVLLAGVAGLLAGAFSMGAGEYVSMRAQRELFERQIELEREELETAPAEEEQELALIYRAKGLPIEEAHMMASRLMENPEVALETLVREELGLDPSELGSPWSATIGSFLAFAMGAVVPIIPFLFGANASAPFVVASATLSALALLFVGASLSLFTGRSPLLSAARQFGVGFAAGALTFGIGIAIGVSTGV